MIILIIIVALPEKAFTPTDSMRSNTLVGPKLNLTAEATAARAHTAGAGATVVAGGGVVCSSRALFVEQ